jgi:hypothetical protein
MVSCVGKMHESFDTQRAVRQATAIVLALAAVIALALLSPGDPSDDQAARPDAAPLVASR